MPLQILRKDITQMRVDAIVNTTNEDMIGFSGVDQAIHDGAGPDLDAECAKLVPLGLGEAKITKGYNLPARYIIHTSGPVWEGGLRGESVLLRSCYVESLKLAVNYGCESVAFPLISSGTYGYPKDRVLRHAVEIISEFLMEHELNVYLCVYDRTSYEFSQQLYADLNALVGEDEGDFGQPVFCAVEACEEEAVEELRAIEKLCMPSAPMAEHKTLRSSAQYSGSARNKTLDKYLQEMDKSFGCKLFDWIDKRGMTDLECYKKANVDRKTFSKIKCHPDTYRPSKQTAVAFAIALRLDMDETQDLLASAGLTLSRSFVFDKIIRYFIQNEIYDIFLINEALFEFDQVLLGA